MSTVSASKFLERGSHSKPLSSSSSSSFFPVSSFNWHMYVMCVCINTCPLACECTYQYEGGCAYMTVLLYVEAQGHHGNLEFSSTLHGETGSLRQRAFQYDQYVL